MDFHFHKLYNSVYSEFIRVKNNEPGMEDKNEI